MDNNTQSAFIQQWLDQLKKDLILDVAILSLYLVIGVVGNAIVLLVYKYQMKNASDERYFIPVLAVCDLIASIVSSVCCIANDFMKANYSNEALCKTTYFLTGTATFTSTSLLLCIAFQRYLKMCRRYTMSLRCRRILIFGSFVFGFLFALPLVYMYGIVQYSVEGIVVGKHCGKVKYESKLLGNVFGIIACTIIFLTLVAFIILYGKIGYTIFEHVKKGASRKTQKGDASDTTDPNSVDTSITDNATDERVSKPESGSIPSISTVSQKQRTTKIFTSRIEKKNRKLKYKISLMFMVITIVFLICFSPVCIILITEGVDPDFWERLSRIEHIVVFWLYRTYIINNVVNPFIYAFMDAEFRRGTKALFTKCC